MDKAPKEVPPQPTGGIRIVRQRSPRTAPASVKTTINLPTTTVVTLRELSAEQCATQADTITRALSLHKAIREAMTNGGKLFIQEPDKTITQLVIIG